MLVVFSKTCPIAMARRAVAITIIIGILIESRASSVSAAQKKKTRSKSTSIVSATSTVISHDRSATQVADTLQKLWRSIAESSREVTNTGTDSANACDQSLDSLKSQAKLASIVEQRMRSDFDSAKAAAVETEGIEKQVRTDIALVQHTLNQLQADKTTPVEMTENKQQTLNSLEGELGLLLPEIAMMEGRITELTQRLDDHVQSTARMKGFTEALRESCANVSSWVRASADASLHEQGSIGEALQALLRLGSAANVGPLATSFVQIGHSRQHQDDSDVDDTTATDQELLSMFGGMDADQQTDQLSDNQGKLSQDDADDTDDSMGSPNEPVVPDETNELDDVASVRRVNNGGLEKKMRRHIAEMTAHPVGDNSSAWCRRERSRMQISLRVATSSSKEVDTQVQGHKEAEAVRTRDFDRIGETMKLVENAAQAFAQETGKHRNLLRHREKERLLAAKILKQAVAVVAELKHASLDEKTKKYTGNAADALRFALQTLEDQSKYAQKVFEELGRASSQVTLLKMSTIAALAAEKDNVDMIRDGHVAERKRCEESKSMYDAQSKQASLYMAVLDKECDAHRQQVEEENRETQIHALGDAADALDGKPITPPPQAGKALHGLRGQASGTAERQIPTTESTQKLTPLERAAAAMGVEIESTS